MIVSVEELKAHLRIQQDAEDKLLENLLMQAQAAANDFCRTDFDADAPDPSGWLCCSWLPISTNTGTHPTARPI